MTQDRTRAIVEAVDLLFDSGVIHFDARGDVKLVPLPKGRAYWDALVAARRRPIPEVSIVERLDTLRRLIDLTDQNARRSMQRTTECVLEELEKLRSEIGGPVPVTPPEAT